MRIAKGHDDVHLAVMKHLVHDFFSFPAHHFGRFLTTDNLRTQFHHVRRKYSVEEENKSTGKCTRSRNHFLAYLVHILVWVSLSCSSACGDNISLAAWQPVFFVCFVPASIRMVT